MNRMFVVTNPVPLHNISPLVSLGKFLQVIDAAGYNAEIIGARIPDDGIPGIPDGMCVRSYRYGGTGVLKKASYVLLQFKLFFSGLFRFKRGDTVYYWIADKMIGSYLAAKIKGAENNFFLYGKISSKTIKLGRKLEKYMTDHADYVCAEAASVLDECNISDANKRDVIQLFVPRTDIVSKTYSDRDRLFVMMSRLSSEKYPFESIRAVVKLHEKMPDIRLRIIGGGPLENECRELVHELNADDFIEFTGWIPSVEAKKQLSEGYLLLYPSGIEGVPGGILEAMSFGIPAIASPVGGIPDVIENGVNGIILNAPNAETIERQVIDLINSEKLPEMSVAARKTIEDFFSLEYAANNFVRVRESHKQKDEK